MGVPEADLLRKYPGLRAADLAAAWDYVDAFTDEIEAAIRAQDEADDEAV